MRNLEAIQVRMLEGADGAEVKIISNVGGIVLWKRQQAGSFWLLWVGCNFNGQRNFLTHPKKTPNSGSKALLPEVGQPHHDSQAEDPWTFFFFLRHQHYKGKIGKNFISLSSLKFYDTCRVNLPSVVSMVLFYTYYSMEFIQYSSRWAHLLCFVFISALCLILCSSPPSHYAGVLSLLINFVFCPL